MKQALHIFAKDSRRFWPEILVSFVATLVFAKLYPEQWGAHVASFWFPSWVPNVAAGLVPVGWWLLISRSVHAESLVGERQFWVTRPYRWGSLLAAKLLFIVVYVLAPFGLALCLILREGGFHPSQHLGGLLFEVMMTWCIIVMPLLVLASVTSSFARVTVAIVIVLAYAGLIGYLSTLLPTSSPSSDFGGEAAAVLLECAFAGVIVLQFARRRTAMARMLIAAIGLVIAGFALVGPEDLPMRQSYPPQANERSLPLNLSFNTDADALSNPIQEDDPREVIVSFPIHVAGIGPGYAVKADNAKVTITTQAGEHWTSHWQGVYLTWLPGASHDTIALKVRRSFFERVKNGAVRVELTLALTELQSGEWTRMRLPEGSFTIPGGSICHRAGYWTNDLTCRSALRQPPLMLAATRFATQPCSRDRVLVSDGDTGTDWVGTTDTDPADFGLTSVWSTDINFMRYASPRSQSEQHLCPGSVVAFAPYKVRDRRQ